MSAQLRPDDDRVYLLRTECLEPMDLDDEPYTYVTPLRTNIGHGHDRVGEAQAFLFHIRDAVHDGIDLADLFNSVDDDVHAMFDAVLASATGGIQGIHSDLLFIRDVKVVATHRGAKIGLRAVQRLARSFGGGSAVAVLKAAPVVMVEEALSDWDKRVFSAPFSAEGDAAKAKLQAYWSEIGFRLVKGTDFMVRDTADGAPPLRA
jgi:hypothetical protein